MRVNYVAGIYKRANRLNMCLDNPEDHGWSPDGATIWSNNVFPEDVKDALLDAMTPRMMNTVVVMTVKVIAKLMTLMISEINLKRI